MSSDNARDKPELRNQTFNRRNMLLGGTTLAVSSVIASGSQVHVAQAQQQQTGFVGTHKPNILMIMADDIGYLVQHQRLQPRHHGLPDAEH